MGVIFVAVKEVADFYHEPILTGKLFRISLVFTLDSTTRLATQIHVTLVEQWEDPLSIEVGKFMRELAKLALKGEDGGLE